MRARWSWTIKGHVKNLLFCAKYTGAFPSVLAGKWQDTSMFSEGHPSCWVKKAFEGDWEEMMKPLGAHSKDVITWCQQNHKRIWTLFDFSSTVWLQRRYSQSGGGKEQQCHWKKQEAGRRRRLRRGWAQVLLLSGESAGNWGLSNLTREVWASLNCTLIF